MAARLAPQRNFVTITPTTNQSVNQMPDEMMTITSSSSAATASGTTTTTTMLNGTECEIITIIAAPSSGLQSDAQMHLNNSSNLQLQHQEVSGLDFIFWNYTFIFGIYKKGYLFVFYLIDV